MASYATVRACRQAAAATTEGIGRHELTSPYHIVLAAADLEAACRIAAANPATYRSCPSDAAADAAIGSSPKAATTTTTGRSSDSFLILIANQL